MLTMQELVEAARLLDRGDASGARRLLQTFVISNPRSGAALHLLGIAERRLENLDGSITQLQKALALGRPSPALLNDLGLSYAARGDHIQSEACYRRALETDSGFIDARHNFGLLLLSIGRASEAEAELQRVVDFRPRDERALEALASAKRALGNHADVLSLANAAVSASGGSARALYNLGQACMAVSDYPGAAEAYGKSAAKNPQMCISWIGLGHARRGMGDLALAIQAYERAIEAEPDNTDAHRLLNEVLWQAGQTTKLFSSFRHAVQAASANLDLKASLAADLVRFERYDEASRLFLEIIGKDPGNRAAHDGLAVINAAAGKFPEAIDHHVRATTTGCNRVELFRHYGETLLKASRHDDSVRMIAGALKDFPDDQGLLALMTVSQRLAGDESFKWLSDYVQYVSSMPVEPPEGFESIEHFCADLSRCLHALHTAKANPSDQTLVHGSQTFGALFQMKLQPVQQLVVKLKKAVRQYIDELPNDPSHPFLRRKSGQFEFSGSWSVKLSEGGYHNNHFHPEGWISSAFYVELPDVIRGNNQQEGWLKIGETNLGLGEREAVHRLIEPKVGHLALFPSFAWHGTVPFRSRSPRLTVAFDVIPR